MQITPAFRLSRQIALFVALAFCSQVLPAQTQGGSNDPYTRSDQMDGADASDVVYTTEHLDGVVLSSADGKPVPRVLVTSPDQRMAAITDSGGRFSFDFRRVVSQSTAHTFSSYPLDPATAPTTITIRFHIVRPGYVGDDVTLRVPAIQPDAPGPPLQLKIVPAAVLSGHLDPDAGDLPTDCSVQLARKTAINGEAVWRYFSAPVSSRGEFRFANLSPGDYKLLAPAYVPSSKLKEPLPDSIPGFRATFYPNASSFDSAGIIHLGPDEATRADLVYRSATFYNVVVPVTGLPDGKGFAANLLPDLPGISVSQTSQHNAAQGYFPNGAFNIQLTSVESSDGKGQMPTFSVASVHLQVDGKPVRTQPIAFHPAFQVPVDVRVEFTNSPPPQPDPQHPHATVFIGIGAVGTTYLNPRAISLQGGPISIQNLSEGLFAVRASSYIGGYVASMTSGTTDLLREPLQVLAGVAPRPIEIVLRDDPGSINAHFARGANLLPQAIRDQPVFPLIIPLDRPLADAIKLVEQQDSFQIPKLAPGRYLLLASHHQWDQSSETTSGVEYGNEDVIHSLMSKGVVVTLSPGQTVDAEIPLMPEDAN